MKLVSSLFLGFIFGWLRVSLSLEGTSRPLWSVRVLRYDLGGCLVT